jgi:hypothetical protein
LKSVNNIRYRKCKEFFAGSRWFRARSPVKSVNSFSCDCLRIAVQNAVGCFISLDTPFSPCISLVQRNQCQKPHCLARRGYRRRLSTPVVDGTGVDLAQLGQGSYAPAWAIGTVRLNRFRHGRTNVLMPRAHFSPKNRNRRFSARHSAVKTAEGACERSEVLTARKCRALQSHAVFWEMRHKNVKHRLNNLSRRYT